MGIRDIDGKLHAEPKAPGSRVLIQGLELLRLLAQADGPVSATTLAQSTGQHPSTVSRLLSGLVKAGYLRKPAYHSFSVDLGLITLLGRVRQHFPLTSIPRAALVQQARDLPGLRFSLATMYEHQVVYWLIVEAGREPIDLVGGGFPLHLSSIALRILLDQPRSSALALLEESRRWHGWERPTPLVPADAKSTLSAARALLQDDILVLAGWQGTDLFSAAVPLPTTDGRPLILALSGTMSATGPVPELLLRLQAAGTAVQQAMSSTPSPP